MYLSFLHFRNTLLLLLLPLAVYSSHSSPCNPFRKSVRSCHFCVESLTGSLFSQNRSQSTTWPPRSSMTWPHCNLDHSASATLASLPFVFNLAVLSTWNGLSPDIHFTKSLVSSKSLRKSLQYDPSWPFYKILELSSPHPDFWFLLLCWFFSIAFFGLTCYLNNRLGPPLTSPTRTGVLICVVHRCIPKRLKQCLAHGRSLMFMCWMNRHNFKKNNLESFFS